MRSDYAELVEHVRRRKVRKVKPMRRLITNANRITPEMVAEAEREYREKLARAETGAGSDAQDGAK